MSLNATRLAPVSMQTNLATLLSLSLSPALLILQQNSMLTRIRQAAEDCPSPPSNREQSHQLSLAGSRLGMHICGIQIHWTESVPASKHNFPRTPSTFCCIFVYLAFRCQNQLLLIKWNACLYALVTVQCTRLHRKGFITSRHTLCCVIINLLCPGPFSLNAIIKYPETP